MTWSEAHRRPRADSFARGDFSIRFEKHNDKNKIDNKDTMKKSLTTKIACSFAASAMLWITNTSEAQTSCPAVPYTNDVNTVLLDHFDGGTAGSIQAYVNDGNPCGSAKPPATPNFAFGGGPAGLAQALALYPPTGEPPGSGSYLIYAGGELLTRPNGTLECWVYLTNYVFNIHQLNFVGECQGDVGGIMVDSDGRVEADIWYTAYDTFHFDSGSTIVPLNTWTHIALSWGSSGAKLYINGALVGSNPNTGGFASWFGQDSLFVFPAGNFVDELRISSVQRTAFNLPACPFSLQLKMFAGLIINGQLGGSYSIQSTPTIGGTNWTTVTNITLTTLPYTFIDYRSPTNSQQFYRVIPL